MEASTEAIEALVNWRFDSNRITTGCHAELYNFSPEWDRMFELEQGAYSKLDQRRNDSGAARLAWQDEEEDRHQRVIQLRSKTLKPMNARLWKYCPLWVHLQRYRGQSGYELDRRVQSWDRVLSDWEDFLALYQDPDFRSTIFPSQRMSFGVLSAWWYAAHGDVVQPTVRSLIKSRQGKRDMSFSVPGFDSGSDKIAPLATSLYQAACFTLFLREFHPRTWEPYTSGITISILQRSRYTAACETVIQKLAYAALNPGPSSGGSAWPYPQVLLNEVLDHATPITSARPGYLWDTSSSTTIEVSSLPQCPPYICISHTWGRWKIQPNVAVPGVPWLVPQNSQYAVRDLPQQLRQLGSRYVWLDLFCIPQDRSAKSEEEINKQASIFKGSERCIAWMHDISSWEAVQQALNWLALRYLRVTSTGDIDRLNNIISTTDIAAFSSTGLMRVPPPRTPKPHSLMDHLKDLVSRVLQTRKEAQIPPQPAPASLIGYKEYQGQPATWFTSLWTLQESVLCPDLELYTRSWQRLEDSRGCAIPLRAFLVCACSALKTCWLDGPIDATFSDPVVYSTELLHHKDRTRTLKDWKIPYEVAHVLHLPIATRLDNAITTGLPTPVLSNSNIRQCTSDRSRAIMSALGVTGWHTRAMKGRTPAADLVLGVYHIEFIREAALKFGGLFYESKINATKFPETVRRTVFHRTKRWGSMLPFSGKSGLLTGTTGSFEQFYVDNSDHPSLCEWTICLDGSVTIPSVGIMASSEDEVLGKEKIPGIIYWDNPHSDADIKAVMANERTDDIRQQICAAGEHIGRIYAISLFRDSGHERGLLLLEFPRNFVKTRKYLAKIRRRPLFEERYFARIGGYTAFDTPQPPAEDVTWRVL